MPQIEGIERARTTPRPLDLWSHRMSFILGIILFVVVVGALDARLPWPSARSARNTQNARTGGAS